MLWAVSYQVHGVKFCFSPHGADRQYNSLSCQYGCPVFWLRREETFGFCVSLFQEARREWFDVWPETTSWDRTLVARILFAVRPLPRQVSVRSNASLLLVNIIIDDGQHMTVQRLSTVRGKCEISLAEEVSSNRVCPINLTLSRKVNQWSMPS